MQGMLWQWGDVKKVEGVAAEETKEKEQGLGMNHIMHYEKASENWSRTGFKGCEPRISLLNEARSVACHLAVHND